MPAPTSKPGKRSVKATAANPTKPAPKARAKAKPPRDLEDWRDDTLARMRALILEADPKMVEERKWKKPSNGMTGIPVWSHDGLICTGETYKDKVKLTFAHGAALADPAGLFNAGFGGGTRRAIDIPEGGTVDAKAFKTLVKAAVVRNQAAAKSGRGMGTTKPKAQPVKLLSGGNPKIAKAEGDAPVQAYIAAMPGWKRDVGRQLDALIVRTVPNVRKAVKWNSPFYGIEGQGWFLSFHVLTKYVKVTFFNGMSLRPVPPGGTPKSREARWLDIYETDTLDEALLKTWVKQAAALPGWIP